MAEPYCLAMVLCDSVHRDPATGKFTILGTFGAVTSDTYPTSLSLCVYSAVTDASGDFRLKFQLVDSQDVFDDDDNEPLFSIEVGLNSPSPLAVCEGVMGVKAMIPEPGVYHCELLHEGDVLMSRRLVAIKHDSGDGGDEENEN